MPENKYKKIKETLRQKKIDRLTSKWEKKADNGEYYKGEKMSKKDIRRYERSDRKIAKGKDESKWGYDYESAINAGDAPREEGEHWVSENPETGQYYKGKKHPTVYKAKKIDRALGYKIKRENGRLYSKLKKKK